MHQVEARATAKYRGVHFGLLREKRSEFRGRDGPGPGLYSPKPSSDMTTMTSKVRMYVRMCLLEHTLRCLLRTYIVDVV